MLRVTSKSLSLLTLALTLTSGIAAQIEQKVKLSSQLNESSGVALSTNGKTWQINDSGDGPFLYEVDEQGQVQRKVTVQGATNTDWEDLTRDDTYLYIADVGNNANTRKEVAVYRVPIADLKNDTVQAEAIRFSYPDQQAFPPAQDARYFDCEALIVRAGQLFLFMKSRAKPFKGRVWVYRVVAEPGRYVAQNHGHFVLKGKSGRFRNWITAADYFPKADRLVLLTSNKLWIAEGFNPQTALTCSFKKVHLGFSQKEAVTFLNEHQVLVTSERFYNLFAQRQYVVNLK